MTNNSLLDRLIDHISSCQLGNVIAVTTMIVAFVSVPLVYSMSILFSKEFTDFLLFVSISLPLIVTPIILILVAQLSKHLEYYKKNLEKEIDKSHKKDLMLFEQARFVLMGEMMANISHQWKQPLNNMGLAIVSTRLSANDPEQLNKNFDIMEDNISYLSNTIDDFMSFFDKKTPEETRTIKNIVDEIRSIIQSQIESRGIKFVVNIDKRLEDVKMTSVISQVLLNLINNSKDAMNENLDYKEIILYFEILKGGFRISCCDNGSGVDKSVADKIFDPYFTTKEKKQGTGIGLYMSKQIITKIFDGTIELDKHSKNTCFRINIPCSKNCTLEGLV